MKSLLSRTFVPVLLAASALTLPGAAGLAHADTGGILNVRGKIASVKGSTLKVTTHEGKTVEVALVEGVRIAGLARAAIGDIKPGDFVGIASLPRTEGGDGALEVLIFPPAMKGTGEGSYGWDLKPNSSMTNATVANAVKGVDGHSVTVSYHGKEKKFAIPDGTPVVTLAPASSKNLVAGASVFIPAMKDAKGALLARQVVVGTNGIVPPM